MKKDVCAVCAWREGCARRFSVSGRDVRCPDFVKDVSLEKKEKEPKAADQKEK
jgi:hypothetical protein